jgi:nitroimidazol reductase NimA-like FMN-containing flavoprotein (pyridoxamine 5'-phosphate oxidase superfamily)
MATTEESRRIFAENYVGCIATVNDDGSPWTTPLHMASDGEYVYWFSNETERHAVNHERDDRVSLALYAPEGGPHKEGIYLNGRVEKIQQDKWPEIRDLLVDRLGFELATFSTGAAYRMPIGTFDEQKSTGNCWYFYS